jgi:hypothetical protein
MVSCDETDVALVEKILGKYHSLNHKPIDGTYTILAAVALTSPDPDFPAQIIALATGCKCLPKDRLPEQGDALHDSHAEVLARRSTRRWFLEEIGRSVVPGGHSQWLARNRDGMFSLKHGVRVTMYISTPPCNTPLLPLEDADHHLRSRWGRIDALSCVISRRGDGKNQGIFCFRGFTERRRLQRSRQLLLARSAANEARAG